jgi:hypothetical protein
MTRRSIVLQRALYSSIEGFVAHMLGEVCVVPIVDFEEMFSPSVPAAAVAIEPTFFFEISNPT